jgi:UDP-glucose 4-epimerase
MKVLITGVGGYIGGELAAFLAVRGFEVERLNLREPFDERRLAGFDTVVHTAAVVHKRGTQTEYFKINTELSYELARKCKNAGVRHFIFLSTVAVFGDVRIVGRNVPLRPVNFYGKSKLLAEEKIWLLAGDDFLVAIIRPPVVYGKNCPGNFGRLVRFSDFTPVFPMCKNKRPMIYIGHLLEFIKNVIINRESGVFHPRNQSYVCVSELVLLIRKIKNKKTFLLPGFGFLRKFNMPVINKIFSDMVYSDNIETEDFSYCTLEFEETVVLSV